MTIRACFQLLADRMVSREGVQLLRSPSRNRQKFTIRQTAKAHEIAMEFGAIVNQKARHG